MRHVPHGDQKKVYFGPAALGNAAVSRLDDVVLKKKQDAYNETQIDECIGLTQSGRLMGMCCLYGHRCCEIDLLVRSRLVADQRPAATWAGQGSHGDTWTNHETLLGHKPQRGILRCL